MKGTYHDLLLLLGILIGGLVVVQLSSCSAVAPGAGRVDVFGPSAKSHATCDFGILRGTQSMRCSEEFKRRAWQ